MSNGTWMRKLTTLNPQNYRKYLIPSIFILLFAIIGALLLHGSKAAGPYASVEASSGTLTNGATSITDSSASNNSYVQFGTESSGGGGTTSTGLSGVYIAAADPTDATNFGTWRGLPVTLVSDYLPNSDWSGFSNPSYWVTSWSSLTSKGAPLVLGVPMIPTAGSTSSGTSNCGETFQDAAAGDYDSNYTALAAALVSEGDSNVIIRLAWEFNGDWYPWSISTSNCSGANSPAEFVAAWQHTVSEMRSVSGQNFKFIWNVNNGYPGFDMTTAYPGNSYVDYVGVDAYDINQNWSNILNQTDGLAYWLSFAQQHSKQLAIPEWGLSGADDPTYIQDMYDWMKTNSSSIGLEAYFDYQDALRSGGSPNSAAKYQQLYQSGLW